jgi:hypothetical protein
MELIVSRKAGLRRTGPKAFMISNTSEIVSISATRMHDLNLTQTSWVRVSFLS